MAYMDCDKLYVNEWSQREHTEQKMINHLEYIERMLEDLTIEIANHKIE